MTKAILPLCCLKTFSNRSSENQVSITSIVIFRGMPPPSPRGFLWWLPSRNLGSFSSEFNEKLCCDWQLNGRANKGSPWCGVRSENSTGLCHWPPRPPSLDITCYQIYICDNKLTPIGLSGDQDLAGYLRRR